MSSSSPCFDNVVSHSLEVLCHPNELVSVETMTSTVACLDKVNHSLKVLYPNNLCIQVIPWNPQLLYHHKMNHSLEVLLCSHILCEWLWLAVLWCSSSPVYGCDHSSSGIPHSFYVQVLCLDKVCHSKKVFSSFRLLLCSVETITSLGCVSWHAPIPPRSFATPNGPVPCVVCSTQKNVAGNAPLLWKMGIHMAAPNVPECVGGGSEGWAFPLF
jgi:hypothetical protein